MILLDERMTLLIIDAYKGPEELIASLDPFQSQGTAGSFILSYGCELATPTANNIQLV